MSAVLQSFEEPCTEFVPWRNPYLMLGNAVHHYIHEHLMPEGRDHRRIIIVAKHAFRLWGPETNVTKLDRAQTRHYTATRRSEGAANATIRRELALVHAAIAHNAVEERIPAAAVPKFVMPPQSSPRTRWLTRDEHRKLMQQPMDRRTYLFLLLAFGTGARSEAIEQATWDRVDWTAKTIDYRVPNVTYRNKRRVVAPISDVLFRRLEAAFARRDPADPFVIGRGPTTYRRVKAAMKAIGINERGVARHVARHTFCSWLVQQGVSYALIGALVGDQASMIERVYAHLAPDHTREAVNMVFA